MFYRTLVISLILLLSTSSLIIQNVEAQEDSWVPKTPIPTQRYGLKAATVDEKIFAIGGILLHGPLHVRSEANEEYDPVTDTWVSRNPLPTPRANFGIAVYQNKIYCIGGSIYTYEAVARIFKLSDVNEVYDSKTDTWENKTSLPTPRENLDANILNGKIYLIGGTTGEQISNLNEVYDPQTDTWTTMSPLPTPVSLYASAVVDNKIFVIGGQNGNGPNYLTQIYDPTVDSWSQGSSVPFNPEGYYPGGAVATSGVFAPKRIYVFGGLKSGLFGMSLNTTLVYDPEKDAWSYGAQMITGRSNIGVASVKDILYAVGGVINMGKYTGANEQYTPIDSDTSVTPIVSVLSPQMNKTYTSINVSLVFTVSTKSNWLSYSVDGQDAVAITGNTTLANLSFGLHNMTVYVKNALENTETSQTVYFIITEPEPFPTTIAVALIATIVVIGIGILIHFKKNKRSN